MQTPIASEKVQSAGCQLRYHHGIQTILGAVGMTIQKVFSGVWDVHKGTWWSMAFYQGSIMSEKSYGELGLVAYRSLAPSGYGI